MFGGSFMRKRIITCVLAVSILCMLFCGCENKETTTVSVQSVGLLSGIGSVGLQERYAGVVSAGENMRVDRDENMKIKELLVSAGEVVAADQILFTYDTDAISLSLDKMKLELEQLKASTETKAAQIEQLEQEKAKAKQEDQLDYTLQIQELQIDLTENDLNIKAKEKDIEQTERFLENDKVRSPIDGRIQSINENGGYDDMGNPLPYISIAQTSTYRVKGVINEQNAAALMEGMPVCIRSRVNPEQTWNGAVEMIDWDNPIQNNNYWGPSDEMSQSSKYPFYVGLDSDEGLMLGQHVYIEPWTGDEEGENELRLPSWCLNDADTESPWVWAVDAQKHLEKRPVKLGEYDPDTDTYPVLEGLTVKDYIAPPGEDCEEGADVVFYSESDFETPVNTRDVSYDNGEFGMEEGGYGFEGGESGFGEEGIGIDGADVGGFIGNANDLIGGDGMIDDGEWTEEEGVIDDEAYVEVVSEEGANG